MKIRTTDYALGNYFSIMIARVMLLLVASVQLMFFVAGNCTTELDETADDHETISPSAGIDVLGQDTNNSVLDEED